MKKHFVYINPNYDKECCSAKLEIDSVYIHISNIKIRSNRERPLFKIINPNNQKSVIRKLRGKNDITGNQILFDKMTYNELGLKNGDIELKPINKLEQYTTYLWYHPKEDTRIAYKCFLFGVVIGLISITLSLISIIK